MKTNIKMRVAPEQLEKICKIVGKGWLYFKSAIYMYIFNDGSIEVSYSKENWNKYNLQEIDADLFIRTNGTCEENNNSIDYETLRLSHLVLNSKYEELEQKLKKKNEILKKARIKRKNQREELHKLNLKLQKCISLEEHNKKIESIEFDLNMFKSSNKLRGDLIEKLEAENIEMTKQIEKINKDNVNYLSDNILSRDKEIEKLKAVIEYLESKVK